MVLNPKTMISSLEKNVDKISKIVGLIQPGVDGLVDSIQRMFSGQIHFPVEGVLQAYTSLPEVQAAIKAAIIGYLAGEAGVAPFSKYGKLIYKGAGGFLVGRGINHIAYHITHGDVTGVRFPKGAGSPALPTNLY
ncbi:hypothetical protein KAR91_45850 [Candidatus Pacearchaeota archaeon]|nr:hypothetical protein [Candidatus Pacearchaeota archaeon]